MTGTTTKPDWSPGKNLNIEEIGKVRRFVALGHDVAKGNHRRRVSGMRP